MENKQEIDVNADKTQASDVYKKLPDDPNASQDDNSVNRTGRAIDTVRVLLRKTESKFCLFYYSIKSN